MLTWVDLLLIVVVGLAAVGGYRRGVSLVGGRLAGGLLGLTIGLAAAPWIGGLIAGMELRALVEVVLVLVAVGLGASYGTRAGWALRSLFHRGGLRSLDGLGGAVLRGGVALILGWLVITLVATYAPPRVAAAAARASLPARLAGVLPAPTQVVGDVASALDIRLPAQLPRAISGPARRSGPAGAHR